MGNVVNLDAVRVSKRKQKEEQEREATTVTYNYHESIYQPTDTVEFGIRTEILSEALTKHLKLIDALKPNQKFDVSDLKVNNNISFVKGNLSESLNN